MIMKNLDLLIKPSDRAVPKHNYGSKYLLGRRVTQEVTPTYEPDPRKEPATRELRNLFRRPGGIAARGQHRDGQCAL